MTVEEREAFLADVHVGVLAIAEPDRGPFALPIWYVYEDGEVLANLDDETLKARLLRDAGRATLTVQTEAAPYQYVSVEGPVEITSRSVADIDMATRYLGPEFGRWYVDNNPA